MSILFKFSKKIGFWLNFRKFSIRVNFCDENFDFVSKNYDFFSKNYDFGYFDFGQNFRKISIFSKIWKNFDFVKFSKKLRFWSKFRSKFTKNFDFFEDFEKCRFESNFR